MFHILKTFKQYDLYSKCDEIYDGNKLTDYYMGLIKKHWDIRVVERKKKR